MNKVLLSLIFLLSLLLASLSFNALAAEWTESPTPYSVVCAYTEFSSPDGLKKVSKPFELTFLVTKKESGSALMIGNVGTTKVVLFTAPSRASFLEITDTGNLMTTAVDASLNSVHSRNTILGDHLVPSQYYGKCEMRI